MNELRSAVDAVLAQDPHTLPGPELAERLMCIEREIARLMAAQLAALAVFDARGDYAEQGAPTAGAWLCHHCRLSPGEANSRVRVSRRLCDQLDATREALAEGAVTFAQARVISEQAGRVADRLGEPGVLALKEAEPIFLQAAQRLHPNDLGKVVKRWEHVVDTDGFLTDHNRRYERRFLNFSQGWDGMWHIDGMLDPESGATVHAALMPLATPAGADDTRDTPQRRCDALTEIARRVLDSGSLPQVGGEKPHLVVEVTLETLEKRLGAPAAELAGTPIPAETARRLACDAPRGAGITAARQKREQRSRRRCRPARKPGGPRRGASAKRFFRRAPRRRAAWLPGRAWTDGHHIDHWVQHEGPTKLKNLTLLCRRHHRLVHEGGQTLAQPP